MHGLACQLDFGESADESGEGDLGFESGDGHAGAGVAAGGEGQVVVGFAGDIEDFGMGELITVAIRGADA
jgi:hypothetical protein